MVTFVSLCDNGGETKTLIIASNIIIQIQNASRFNNMILAAIWNKFIFTCSSKQTTEHTKRKSSMDVFDSTSRVTLVISIIFKVFEWIKALSFSDFLLLFS